MVHINGKDENAAGMTIQKYLDDNDYKVTHIAVECNEKIIDKSDYSNYILKDNDVVEIVSFVGGGSGMSKDTFTLGGKEFSSRFILGSGKYSMELIKAAVENAGAQIITLAVRRTNTKKSENILDYIPEGVTLLPNTSGARDAKEAVRIARMSRELGCGDFVKIEIMKDSKYLLAKEGFTVLPYMYPDLYTARDLANAGAAAIMPLASPIGSNKGLATKEFIQIIIDESDLPVIVDAGIGKPSQACEAMEMGAAAIMANTAIATAGDIPAMAGAFKSAIEAGRSAYLAGLGRVLERGAQASDPLTGFLRD